MSTSLPPVLSTTPAQHPAPAGATAPVLQASGLVKSYGTTTAVAGVDLQVHRGEALAVMGASGSGKSTLVHLLAGILTPDDAPTGRGRHGSVTLSLPEETVDVAAGSPEDRARIRRRHFGFVFQEGLLLPELTAIENVALPLMLTGVRRGNAERHAAAWLAHLGLAGMETRRTGTLSGGQAQRVAIARAQVTSPAVVFADEPTGALDSVTSADTLTALLAATTDAGRTLVVVTHDQQVADRCHRIITLADGRLVSDVRRGRSDAVAVAR